MSYMKQYAGIMPLPVGVRVSQDFYPYMSPVLSSVDIGPGAGTKEDQVSSTKPKNDMLWCMQRDTVNNLFG